LPVNETELSLLIDAARAAGEIDSRYVRDGFKTWEKSDGAGPVTEADLEIDAMLRDSLTAARPGYGWLSEESPDDPARLNADRVFIVDPLDGTRSFISGEKTWAHSIALAERGRIIAAAIYLPMLDKLYTAAEGSGAHLNGSPIGASDASDPNTSHVLAARPALDGQHWPGGVPDLRRSHRPSLAYRLSLVAEGRYDAMFTFRPSWEWDIAAGALILQEAGAVATDKTGGPLTFNNPHPQCNGVLAAGPALHAALLQRLL